MVLIASSRAVLIVFDQASDSVTFIDSHPHAPAHGAVIAQTRMENLKQLCKYIAELYKDSNPACFEISYFQLKQK